MVYTRPTPSPSVTCPAAESRDTDGFWTEEKAGAWHCAPHQCFTEWPSPWVAATVGGSHPAHPHGAAPKATALPQERAASTRPWAGREQRRRTRHRAGESSHRSWSLEGSLCFPCRQTSTPKLHFLPVLSHGCLACHRLLTV